MTVFRHPADLAFPGATDVRNAVCGPVFLPAIFLVSVQIEFAA